MLLTHGSARPNEGDGRTFCRSAVTEFFQEAIRSRFVSAHGLEQVFRRANVCGHGTGDQKADRAPAQSHRRASGRPHRWSSRGRGQAVSMH